MYRTCFRRAPAVLPGVHGKQPAVCQPDGGTQAQDGKPDPPEGEQEVSARTLRGLQQQPAATAAHTST